ncbi:uncharacterized protein [Palaemon carinicauda]|uniref:uncharacterized protein n=1 Tax=Palaemon carinicauda TaxID=392227 RepID=UPI0035B5F7B7
MVNRFDMGQNGVLDPNKLVFTDNAPGPEKIEVVMGRCFPLHGPGGTYDFAPIPVVRKIVYKNSDGATFTQTFGDLISSENESYKIPTSVIEQHFDAEKQGCKPKTFLKHEASDGTRDDLLISSNNKNSKKNGDIITDRENPFRISNLSTGTHESRKDRHQEKIFSDAQVKNLQFQQIATPGKTGNDTQENCIRKHETNVSSVIPDIQEMINQIEPRTVISKEESHIQETPSLKYHEKSPKSSRDKQEPMTQPHQDTTFSRSPENHVQDTINSKLTQNNQVNQYQNKGTPVNIDSDAIRRISKANSPRFRVKRVENSKPPEVSGREAWEETQKKKAQLREEFFRVPYEECNREALRGMGGRHKSEPRLNSLAKERKKRNSLSEKRVHFNMDDSQLEDIRKWREERRMQATPQCIKTVARIYSIDAPSNQRKVEYIDSFSVPKPEVPDAVTLVDCTSVRAKHSRPTDLDSLNGNFASRVSLASNIPPNFAEYSSDSNFPMKRPVIKSPEYSTRPQTAGYKRFDVSQVIKGTSDVTSRVPHTSHHNLKDENQSPTPLASNHSVNGSSILSPSASLYATFSKPPERKVSPSDYRIESQLTADQQDAKFSLRYHTHGPPRSISSPKLIDSLSDSQSSKCDSSAVQAQNVISPKTPFDPTDNNRMNSKLEDPTKIQERQNLKHSDVQTQKHQQENKGHAGKTQENSTPTPMVELRNLRPTSFQSPLPLPRVKSLTSTEELPPQDSPSTSIQMDRAPSERSKAFTFGRAKSLDRATIRQRTAGRSVNSSPYLKSPGLILSHMRSPVTTIPTHNQLIENPMDGNNTHSFSPYRPISTLVQNNQADASGIERSQFTSDLTPKISKSDQPNSVDIIKSYTYPKRSSVTVLQKDHHTDIGATAKSTVNNSGQTDYHKHTNQHFKPLANNSDIRNNLGINGSHFNQSSKPSFQAAPSIANGKATHKNDNKENEENSNSQKTLPNRKGNSVNILMTQGESYSKHRILLNTHTKSMSPRMTVKKIIVPASSVSGYARPGPSATTRSPPSPTPSCASSSCSFGSSGSSSGCFSGSPSPTPTPSPIRTRASRVPTDL